MKVLDGKLRWLAEQATFQVNINSVIGTSEHPEDALAVAPANSGLQRRWRNHRYRGCANTAPALFGATGCAIFH
jgi:hypothetical protein